jgi:ElaB/YqjD/DUF883 family membrane-anchored ribosome-binding protein
MDQEPDVIRQQIDETRSSLTDKLETLENQVRGTVQDAKATVQETIQSVKATVNETVDSVKRTFDLNYQVEQHPWAMVGGSVLAGFLVGSLLKRRPGHASSWVVGTTAHPAFNGPPRAEAPRFDGSNLGRSFTQPAAAGEQPGLLSRLYHQFEGEIEQVKQVAIGATMGLLRDLVKQSLPQLAPHIDEVMNSATTKLGGKPIDRPLVQPERSGASCQP